MFRRRGSRLEHAQQIAGHASLKTTKLYDRSAGTVTVDRNRAYRDLNGGRLRTAERSGARGVSRMVAKRSFAKHVASAAPTSLGKTDGSQSLDLQRDALPRGRTPCRRGSARLRLYWVGEFATERTPMGREGRER